jgi:uncharacterized delta-60 repeat protein
VALTPDGKVVVTEQVYTGDVSLTAMQAVRLNPDGSTDPTFGANGTAVAYFGGMNPVGNITRAAVAPDGSVLAYGTNFGSDSLFKWTPQGVLDPGFGTEGRFRVPETSVSPLLNQGAVAVRPDGSVVLMHSVWQLGPMSGKFPTSVFVTTVYQFTPQGAADPAFGTGGSVTSPFPGYDMALDSAGNIVLAGSRSVGRLTPAGAADTSWVADQPSVPPTYGVPVAVAVGPGGAVQLALSQTPGSPPPASYPSFLVSRWLGPTSPPVAGPGAVLVGGPANGTAAVLNQVGGVYAAAGTVPFFPGFAGDVRTASADVNGDGVPDYIGGAAPGGGPRVAVIDGATGATLADFFAFEPSFTGGVFVAAGDFTGDGRAEVVVTPDRGGGPRVEIFALENGSPVVRNNFFGIDDPNFRGGCRAAAGDVNGDGATDLAVAAGFGGGPRVALFDGATIFSGTPARLVNDFFAFPGPDTTMLRNGVFVAAGDVDGDGKADLIFGGGPGGAPRVLVLSGQLLLTDINAAYNAPVANFFVAGNSSDRGGVKVATKSADGDNRADVVAGSGEGSPSRVRVYIAKNVTDTGEPATFQDLDPFGGAVLAAGVFIG